MKQSALPRPVHSSPPLTPALSPLVWGEGVILSNGGNI